MDGDREVCVTLLPLALPPGVSRNGTAYQSKGRWYDTQLVRFLEGMLLPVGGWDTLDTGSGAVTVTGVPRAMLAWRGNDDSAWAAIGTHSHLYAFADGTLLDITPTTPTALTAGIATATPSAGGYGTGLYGLGLYGQTAPTVTYTQPSVWTLDTFGDYLVGVLAPADGKLWLWNRSPSAEAAQVVDTGDATYTPTQNRAVVVTPERFLMVLGTYDPATGSTNVRRVKWASQETSDDWVPTSLNTAGDFDLETQGALMAGARARHETLLWTDVDMHTAQYIGGPLIYAFHKVGDHCGLIAPNAKALYEGGAAWMSPSGFFLYDGFVRQLPCEVYDYVFGDFNRVQARKVWALPNAQFSEIWWFYPSGNSDEVNRYVIWNYREGHWAVGALDRTAGCDRGAFSVPLAASSAGSVYRHELGLAHDGTLPYATTGPLELGDGDRVVSLRAMIPDEQTVGEVTGTFTARLYPTSDPVTVGPVSMSNPTSLRVTGRQVQLTVTATADDTDWRLGIPRLDVTVDGER